MRLRTSSARIKIMRHALPRLALGRADIARRRRDDACCALPLHLARHAIEPAFQAGIGIAAAALLPAASRAPAAPPQRKSVAIAPLQREFFDREAPRVFHGTGLRLALEPGFQHGEVDGEVFVGAVGVCCSVSWPSPPVLAVHSSPFPARGERGRASEVGGALGLTLFAARQEFAETPPHPRSRVALSPHAGRGEQALSFSRRGFAPELCKTSHVKREDRGGREYRGVVPRCFSVRYARFANFKNEEKKGSGTPTNADPYPPHHRVRRAPLSGSARLSAFHHGSHTRDLLSQGSTRARLPADFGRKRLLRPPRACPSPVMHLTRRS